MTKASTPKPLDIVHQTLRDSFDSSLIYSGGSLSIKERLYHYQSAQIQARIDRRDGAKILGKPYRRKTRLEKTQNTKRGKRERRYKTRLLNKKQQQKLLDKAMDQLTPRQRLMVEKTRAQDEKRKQNRLKFRSLKNEKVIARMAGEDKKNEAKSLTSVFTLSTSPLRRQNLCQRAYVYLAAQTAQNDYTIKDIEKVFTQDFIPFMKSAGLFDVSVNEAGYIKRLKAAFKLYETDREEYFDQYASDIFAYQAEMDRMDMLDGLIQALLSTVAVKDLNIIVTSVYDVEQVIKDNDIGVVLSIEHPGAKDLKGGRAPRLKDVNQKILCFWDTENEDIKQGPTMIDVAEGLAFLENNKDRPIVVHCKAGKRRSVSIVLAYLAKEKGIPEAIKLMKQMRPIATPNILIIALADKFLNMDGALFKAVNEDPEFKARAEKIRQRIKDTPKTRDFEMR